MRIQIVFMKMEGPGNFKLIEVEDMEGKSLEVGTWRHREDDYWVLELEVQAKD